MKKIKNLRKKIDQIHNQIFVLILKRVDLTQEIFKIKNTAKLKITDSKREVELIHQFDRHPKVKKNPELKKMIQQIQKNIIQKNKTYLKQTCKDSYAKS